MRYYRLEFIDPETNAAPIGQWYVFESHPNGIYNPSCTEISFDCLLTEGGLTSQPFHITLHNVPKEMLGMARQYNALNCNLYAGFKSGLPLANPFQSGLIAKGTVQGCYGNWAGTNLTMDFLINPLQTYGSPALNLSSGIYSSTPQYYNFQWTRPSGNQGNTFIKALDTFFKGLGYPGCIGALNSELNQLSNFQLMFTTFDKFCLGIQKVTQQINPPNKIDPTNATNKQKLGNFQPYTGVMLTIDQASGYIIAADGSGPPPVDGSTNSATSTITQLEVQEFVGQPVWNSAAGIIQSIHPLRNDIRVNGWVKYPNDIRQNILVSAANTVASQFYYFNGQNLQLQVLKVRHVGRFRDPNPTSWVTYVDAFGGLRENPDEPNSGINTSANVSVGQPY